jgi:F420-dependent oxidoreductase-like protein
MTVYGVHAGLQHTTTDALRDLWRNVEAFGFDWISIWDHFYAATGIHDPVCHEAVATHAALACTTARVRCGSLVYCAGYRHPAVLANAICTIDHLSGGRADLGLGAGWSEIEYNAYGIDFPAPKIRLDILEESVACIAMLLRQDVSNFEGRYFHLVDARCEPKPLQSRLPLWIGGGGEKRTLKIVATYADGWNVPFVSPETFASKNAKIDEHCAAVGRKPGDIRRSVNLGLAYTEESLRHQFGAISDLVRPGVLTGSDQQIIERIGEYVAAGADQVNIALRAPFDVAAAERFARAAGLG